MSGIVLEPSEDWWAFDTSHVGVGDVQILGNQGGNGGGGIFWMFYYGGTFEERTSIGFQTRIGVALSQDGIHWSRVEGDHHTGAVLDFESITKTKNNLMNNGKWDNEGLRSPCIVLMGGGEGHQLRMYYHSVFSTRSHKQIGMATSDDGFNWEIYDKHGSNGVMLSPGPSGSFDEAAVSCGHVVRVRENEFVMVYEGEDKNGRKCIGSANSPDGIEWTRNDCPILEPSDNADAWDNGSVGSPFLVAMSEGRWRLYYEGRGANDRAARGIGLALSGEGGVASPFKRRGSSSG